MGSPCQKLYQSCQSYPSSQESKEVHVSSWDALIVEIAERWTDEPEFLYRAPFDFARAVMRMEIDTGRKVPMLDFYREAQRLGYELGADDEDEFANKAVRCRQVARTAEGDDALDTILREAAAIDLPWLPKHLRKTNRRLAILAYCLQKAVGDAPFILPQVRLAEAFDVTQQAISDALFTLCQFDILRCVKEANHVEHKAKEYRFVFDQPR